MTRLQLLLAASLFASACAGSNEAQIGRPTDLGRSPDVSDLTAADMHPVVQVEAGAADGEIVAPDQLPANLRDILEAWHTGGFIWEIKRSEALSDPVETAFLVDNLMLLMFSEARILKEISGNRDATSKQRTSLLRVKSELSLCGPVAAEALAATIGLGDDMLFALAQDVLMKMGADAAPATLSVLDNPAALVRYNGLKVLSRLPGAGEEEGRVIAAVARIAVSDSSEIVRLAATVALGERGLFSQSGRASGSVDLSPWTRALEDCLNDPAEAVRIQAVDSLGFLGDRSAVPALIQFGVRSQGIEGSEVRKVLEGLTGQKLGTDFAAWDTWWSGETTKD